MADLKFSRSLSYSINPDRGQLRVRVRAAGVSSTDLIMLAGKYRCAPKIPFVPGYEVAGVLEALGAGVTDFEGASV